MMVENSDNNNNHDMKKICQVTSNERKKKVKSQSYKLISIAYFYVLNKTLNHYGVELSHKSRHSFF